MIFFHIIGFSNDFFESPDSQKILPLEKKANKTLWGWMFFISSFFLGKLIGSWYQLVT